MNFKLLFQPEAAAGLVVCLSILIVIMVLRKHFQETPNLKSKLKNNEASLEKLRTGFTEKKKRVEVFQKALPSLKLQEANLREYSEELSGIVDAEVRQEQLEEESKQITVHRH